MPDTTGRVPTLYSSVVLYDDPIMPDVDLCGQTGWWCNYA